MPRSYLCDGQTDCVDQSDEIGCTAPTVTRPPVPEITVDIGGTIVINCTAIGKPIPLISWRLNWGNIPQGQRVTVRIFTAYPCRSMSMTSVTMSHNSVGDQ